MLSQYFIRASLAFTLLFFISYGDALCQDFNSLSADGEEAVELSLTEAIDLALKANRKLLQSGYGFQNQQLSLQSAKSEFDLQIKPFSQTRVADDKRIVGSGISLDKKFSSGIRASVSPGVKWSGNKFSGSAGVSLSIPLFRGFGKKVNLDSVYRSRFSARAAERSLYASRVDVVLDTVAAAYDITKQNELVKLYAFMREQLRGHAAMAKIKENVGLATPIDIYRAEIRMKDAENSLASAQESLSNAKDRLKLILSLSMDKDIHVSTPMAFEPVHITPEEAVDMALAHRIEIDQREDDIGEARRNADLAKHNLLPALDLVLDYQRLGFSDQINEGPFFGEDHWAIFLSSNKDWVRKRDKISYQQSLLSVKTAQLNLVQQKDEIEREVRRQLHALDKNLERIQIRKEQVSQAESKLALAKIKFNHGMANNFDVIEAETERQRAKVDLLTSEIDYIIGTYRVRSVLGTLIKR